jgi:hypothetical protein
MYGNLRGIESSLLTKQQHFRNLNNLVRTMMTSHNMHFCGMPGTDSRMIFRVFYPVSSMYSTMVFDITPTPNPCEVRDN